jgi:hypothetical protein
MLYRNAFTFAFACVLGVAGCRDNGTVSPVDLSMGGGGGGGTGGGMDMAMAGKTYTTATIAAMRGGAPGDYQLVDVVAIALTPSSKSPKLVVQDAAGGKYTAIQLTCSGSSTTHPCTVASTVHTVTLGHKVTVQGTYIKAKLASGGTETFYLDTITDNGAGTAPAPLTLDEKALARATDTSVTDWNANFWQKVTVTPTEDMVMYDWTPSDLKFSGTWPGCSTAPFVFGFGMIPTSAGTTVMASDACTVKTAPAPSKATSDPKEVLIGTDYYKDFAVSSDCQCAAAPTTVPSATTKWLSGQAITGILGYDVPFGGTVGYKFFSPTQMPANTVLTNLVAPPM